MEANDSGESLEGEISSTMTWRMMKIGKRRVHRSLSSPTFFITRLPLNSSVVSSLVAWCKFNQFSWSRHNTFDFGSAVILRADDFERLVNEKLAFFRHFSHHKNTTRPGSGTFYSDILGNSWRKKVLSRRRLRLTRSELIREWLLPTYKRKIQNIREINPKKSS